MATTKNALKGTSAPLHQDAPVTSGVVDRNGTVIIGCTYCKWPAKCVDSNHDEKKTWLILGKKCIIVFRNVGVGPGVWRTIMFISQLQDWFDLITFLIRFQLKEVCEYASNWYQVYIYIYQVPSWSKFSEKCQGLQALLLLLPVFFKISVKQSQINSALSISEC